MARKKATSKPAPEEPVAEGEVAEVLTETPVEEAPAAKKAFKHCPREDKCHGQHLVSSPPDKPPTVGRYLCEGCGMSWVKEAVNEDLA